jgi:hypothetical protein
MGRAKVPCITPVTAASWSLATRNGWDRINALHGGGVRREPSADRDVDGH